MGATTVDEYDRQISELVEALRQLRVLRKAAVMRERMAANKANPVYLAKWRKGMDEAKADPGRRSLRRINASLGQKLSAKGLPEMTREQRLLYTKLRRYGGLDRAQALAEVFRVSGAPLTPQGRGHRAGASPKAPAASAV